MKQFIYNGEPVFLKAESYRNNGRLALVMVSNDGTIRDVITVNLNSCFQSGSTAFLDINNFPGIEKWIRKNGLGLSMNLTERSGFCEYPLYTIFTNEL